MLINNNYRIIDIKILLMSSVEWQNYAHLINNFIPRILSNCHQVKKFIVPQNEKNELNPHRQVWRDKIFVLGSLQNISLMGM